MGKILTMGGSAAYTYDDAARDIAKIEMEIGKHQHQVLMLRWFQGEVAFKLRESIPFQERQSMYDWLREKTGVHQNTLRIMVRVYEHFEQDTDRFEEWLNRHERPIFAMLESLVKANTDPKVLGPDAYYEKIKGWIQKTTGYLQELNQLAAAGDLEAQGMIMTAVEEIRDFGQYGVNLVFPDDDPVRNDAHLQWVRAQECMVHHLGSGCQHQGAYITQPHHFDTGGKATKGSDGATVPLCWWSHRLYHDNPKKFFERYGITEHELVAETLHRRLFGKHLYIQPDFMHRQQYQQWFAENGSFKVPSYEDVPFEAVQ